MQDLNDLYFFAQVVDKGSFTAASRELGVTKSRLSRRIAQLEENLGVHLLHRSTRHLALTEAGKLYYQHCQALVSEAQAAQEVIEQVQSEPRGRIRVTCPALFGQAPMAPLIASFMQAYPLVEVVLLATDRRVDMIEEGFDVAIRAGTRLQEEPNLVIRTLRHSTNLLVASPGLVARLGEPQLPEDLGRFDSLAKLRSEGSYSWQLSGRGQDRQVAFQPKLESDDWHVLLQAAINGIGVAALPDEICQEAIADGRLVQLLPGWSLPGASVYMLYPSRRGLASSVRAFIDFAMARLA